MPLLPTSLSLAVPQAITVSPQSPIANFMSPRGQSTHKDIWMFGLHLEEDEEISKLIHPAFLTQFKACLTENDDNCLWNAVCLCLGFDEREQIDLREKTSEIIRKHSSHFEDLLTGNMSGLTVQDLVDTCNKSDSTEGWGTEFHILALAILLERNIYVYSPFRKDTDGNMYQEDTWNAATLADHFLNKGSFTSQHYNCEPRKGLVADDPLCIFYNGNHYTALLPRVKNPIYFQPHCTYLESVPQSETMTNRVPTAPGKPGKMTTVFPVLEKYWKFIILLKILEKWK